MIYIDMDGVLCDLMGAVANHLGKPLSGICKPGTWDIHFNFNDMSRDWWSNLPKTQECDALLQKFARNDYAYILTAGEGPECLAGKIVWIRRHAPMMLNRIVFVTGHHKYLLSNIGSLLIDDSNRNIDAWQAGGGKGVLVPRYWNVHTDEDAAAFRRVLE